MAKIIGRPPEIKKRTLLRSLTARLTQTARIQAELEEGYGPLELARRLEGLVLPDSVTIICRPTLGFLHADVCLIAPGVVLVINALHWSGEIGLGQKAEWTGQKGTVDLGRPDRRAALFADRLVWSNLARGFAVKPVVVFTAGPVAHPAEQAEAAVVQGDELGEYLNHQLSEKVAGFNPAELIKTLSS